MAERPFDAKEYWEDRLGSRPGLGGVGNLSLGPAYVRWLYRVRRRVFERLVRSSGVDVERAMVLDVGSGTGFYIDRWRSAGAKSVVASDLTEIAVDRLRSSHPGIRVEQLDIGATTTAFAPESFDVVSAFDVLFHISDEDRYELALRNVALILRPGGWFLFTELPVTSTARGSTQHQVRRSETDLLGALRRNGLRPVIRMPSFVLMEVPASAHGGIRNLLWKALVQAPSRVPGVGFLLGAVLFPFELLLTRIVGRGPSIQAFVCERDGSVRR